MDDKKIDFFIIGTQKSGSTSLYYYLKQHPQIFFSDVKELRYFIDEKLYKKGEKYLNSFFYNYNDEKVIGTAHVHMLPCNISPRLVSAYNKKAKFIISLREPISRANSAFFYALKNCWEKEAVTLYQAFELEKERLLQTPDNYDLLYFSNGLYYKHLANWNTYFDKDSFLIIKDTDLKNNPQDVFERIFSFLEVDSYNVDVSKNYNVGSAAKSTLLQNAVLSRTKFKTILGKLLPQKLKAKIRGNIVPKIIEWNAVETSETNDQKKITILPEEFKVYTNFFKEDQEQLRDKYNIQF